MSLWNRYASCKACSGRLRLSIADTRPPSAGFGGQRQSFYLRFRCADNSALAGSRCRGWLLDLTSCATANRAADQRATCFIGELRPYQHRGVG
jgi:hypothetical protein